MKTFYAAMMASAASARGTSGGLLQGNDNPSLGATHGYGYNVGNDYLHGDSHGAHLAHQRKYGYDDGYDQPLTGDAYTQNNTHQHSIGYDSVDTMDADKWAAVESDQTTLRSEIIDQIDLAQAARIAYIDDVLERRRERLSDIHEDNLLKIEAPFDYQLDMLEEEQEDINDAKAEATADANEAFEDLKERMEDYKDDRDEALDREEEKVIRILERAVEEGKPVDEVLYAMRLDWLAGVYTAGQTAYFDDDIYDMTVFDTEFDMFTYDIGHGKGHGHRNGVQGPGNPTEQGFVTGRGGIGNIDQLNGRPTPKDGKRGRYDRVTQSGEGKVPSMYEIGKRQSNAEGVYNYDQAADKRVDDKVGSKYAKQSQYKRGSAPRRPTKGRPQKRRPSRRPAKRPSKSYGRSRSYRKPQQSYQRTRQISKRTAYDDYAPMRRGGYYGY